MAAVLLATSCSKDDDSVQTQNFASQSQTGIPFSIRVSTGNTLSKIGYAPDADPDKAGYYNISFSKQDENKLAMVISYSGGEELTTLYLANAATGEFTGTIETVPAADAKLVASITTNGKALPTSSDVSLEDLLSKCAHIFKSSTFHYGDEEITLTDRAVYLAISMSPCCEHTIHINNKAYTIKDGRLWVAMSSSGALVCDELGLKKSHINAFAGEIHAVARQYFSVSPTKKVYFSKGNLQYNVNDKCWRFATNQWDYVGGNSQYPGTISGSTNVNAAGPWIDFFGWGMWLDPATLTGNNAKYAGSIDPVMTLQKSKAYLFYKEGGDSIVYTGNLNDLGRSAMGSEWTTLTRGTHQGQLGEWEYLLGIANDGNTVRKNADKLCHWAIVKNVPGLIILPDGYDYSAIDWNSINWSELEESGAVFLPASGFRFGKSVNYVGENGAYWTPWFFTSGTSESQGFSSSSLRGGVRNRCDGLSVRLVRSL